MLDLVAGGRTVVDLAANDEKTLPANKLFDARSAVARFIVRFIVARHLIQHHDEVDGRSTVLSLLQPVVLSIAAVAMSDIVELVSSYELAFTSIGRKQPQGLRRVRAKLVLLVTLHVRLQKVHHFFGFLPGQLADAESWRAARRIVRDQKSGVPPAE